MIDRREAAYRIILLTGSALLLGLSIWLLPPGPALLKAPTTPFDRSDASLIAPAYRLLWRAVSVLPADARVVVHSDPSDPAVDTSLHRYGVALLPGRKVLPAARWNVPNPEIENQAEFVIVVGPRPSSPPGRLLLETPDGSVWRRGSP